MKVLKKLERGGFIIVGVQTRVVRHCDAHQGVEPISPRGVQPVNTLQECAQWHKERAEAVRRMIPLTTDRYAKGFLEADLAMHERFQKACSATVVDGPVSHCCSAPMETRPTINSTHELTDDVATTTRLTPSVYYVCTHCQRSCDPKET